MRMEVFVAINAGLYRTKAAYSLANSSEIHEDAMVLFSRPRPLDVPKSTLKDIPKART